VLYGVGAALVFPSLYFPHSMPPFVAQLASFSTFAVGFLARPVGAVLFGHFGDRAGRRAALVAALCLMGGATTLIGCLPSYATIGVLAPVLLVVLRFLQGLAIGGQWGGAMLLVVESAPSSRRGFYGGFAQAGAPVGVVLANAAFLTVSFATSPAALLDWGWRIPFLISIALIGLALYVHRTVEETPAFRQLKQARPEVGVVATRSPIVEALLTQPVTILIGAGAFVATNFAFYLAVTFIVSYATRADGPALPKATVLAAVMIASALMAPSTVLFGAMSDRYGRKLVGMTGALLLAGWSFLIFPLIDSRSFAAVTLAVGVTLLLAGMMYGPIAPLFGELFKTRVRYSGASLAYQLGAIFGGALAPIVATSLLEHYHSTVPISMYMAGTCLVSFLSLGFFADTRQAVLHPTS
jgi:MFS family permease